MKKLLLLLATGLALCAGLTGCKSYQAELSPDGRTLVVITDNAVTIGPASGGKSHEVLRGEFESPAYSPDGRLVALCSRTPITSVDEKTGREFDVSGSPRSSFLIDPKTGRKVALPSEIRPPFAWRPDSQELLGWKDDHRAVVFNLASKRIVRRMQISQPNSVKWFGEREMALEFSNHVTYWHAGAVRSVPAQLSTIVALSANSKGMVWIEANQGRSELSNSKMLIRTFEFHSREVRTLREIASPTALVGEGPYFVPAAFSISPDGLELAVSGFQDASPAGVLDQYREIASLIQTHPKNSVLKEQEKRVLKKIRMKALTAVVPTHTSGSRVITRSSALRSEANELAPRWKKGLPFQISWSGDGSALALSYTNYAEAMRLK